MYFINALLLYLTFNDMVLVNKVTVSHHVMLTLTRRWTVQKTQDFEATLKFRESFYLTIQHTDVTFYAGQK